MRKKKTIFIILGCILMFSVYLFGYINEETVKVEKSWELSEEEIKSVEIIGLSQGLDITVKKAADGKNVIVLEGSMPKSYVQKIEDIDPEVDKLLITFMNSWGFSVAKNTKDSLRMTIYLTDEKLMEELIVKSNKGNINLYVPNDFERKYQLVTNQGEVVVPKTQYEGLRKIKVELGYGDIKVFKQ